MDFLFSGIMEITWQMWVMYGVGVLLIYLAVAIKSDKVSVLVDNSKNMVLPGLAEYDSRKVLIYFLVLLNLCVAFFESVGMMNIPISYGG